MNIVVLCIGNEMIRYLKVSYALSLCWANAPDRVAYKRFLAVSEVVYGFLGDGSNIYN